MFPHIVQYNSPEPATLPTNRPHIFLSISTFPLPPSYTNKMFTHHLIQWNVFLKLHDFRGADVNVALADAFACICCCCCGADSWATHLRDKHTYANKVLGGKKKWELRKKAKRTERVNQIIYISLVVFYLFYVTVFQKQMLYFYFLKLFSHHCSVFAFALATSIDLLQFSIHSSRCLSALCLDTLLSAAAAAPHTFRKGRCRLRRCTFVFVVVCLLTLITHFKLIYLPNIHKIQIQ